MTAPGVRLDLPEELVVVAAAREELVQVAEVTPELQAWWDAVRSSQQVAAADLVAVRVPSPEDPLPLALVVGRQPLAPEPDDVVVQGLRALAVQRTGPAGEVSVLDLPAGPAVASADAVESAEGPAALVIVHLPLPALAQLLTLTLSSPWAHRLTDCAALAAAVAARVRIEQPEEPGGPAD